MSDERRPFAQVLADCLAKLEIHELPPTHRTILLVIALHAGPDGKGAFPSINRIRAITGYSLSVIVEGLRDLSDAQDQPPNWMGRERRYNPETGAKTSTVYDLRLDGKRWPKSAAKAKRKALSRLPPGGKRAVDPPLPQDTTTYAAGHNEAAPLLCQTQDPMPQDTRPLCRVAQDPIVPDTTDQPSNSPSDQPSNSPSDPATPGAADPPKGQTRIPFGDSQGEAEADLSFEAEGHAKDKDKPKPKKRAPTVAEIPSEDLTPTETKIAQAIREDESFRITVPLPNRTARDLLRIAPDVDIARKIAALGAWMREKPANWRPLGHVFLRKCLEKDQRDAPPKPPPPVDKWASFEGRKAPPIPIPPEIRDARRMVDEARARGETPVIRDPFDIVREMLPAQGTAKVVPA